MNIFEPARRQNETQEEYRTRRKTAKHIMQRISLRGPFATFNGVNLRKQRRANQDMQKRVRVADVLMAHWAEKRKEGLEAKRIKNAQKRRLDTLSKALKLPAAPAQEQLAAAV
ncbi:MAG TPA: hypothetical protein VFM18_07560 [Methanosarcina sp.]|nr:hypothetical protein [Methanosarcina sp.]